MPLTHRVTLDKAQPLPRPQFPHCTVRPCDPSPSPKPDCTQLPPPDLHTALGIAQRNTGNAHTHTQALTQAYTQARAPSGTHIHTSGHTGTQPHSYTFTLRPGGHIPPSHSAPHAAFRSSPPGPYPCPRPPHRLTLMLAHTHPKSAVHQLLARAGLGAGGKKAHDSAGEEGCGGARAREMTARGPPRVPAHEY